MFSTKNTSKPILVQQESEGESEYEGGYNMRAFLNDPYSKRTRSQLEKIIAQNDSFP